MNKICINHAVQFHFNNTANQIYLIKCFLKEFQKYLLEKNVFGNIFRNTSNKYLSVFIASLKEII